MQRVEDVKRMDRFEAVMGRMEKRQIRFEQVQAEHSAALVELRDLASAGIQRADDHSVQLVELKTDVAQLKTDVAGLKADMAEVKTDVAVLKTDVAELKTDVAVLKTDVAELKTGMGTLTGMVQALLDRTG